MLKRVALFLATNIAVLAVIAVVVRMLGLDDILAGHGGALNLQALLVFSAVIGFTGSLISLGMSKWSAKRATGARVIEQPRTATEAWLMQTVARQATAAGIGIPGVAVYESAQPNAFATGWNRNAALIAVSSGLLQIMRREEAEAVLAHEVSHVANGDMVTLTLIQGVVNTFVIFLSRIVGHVVDRTVFRSEHGYGPGYFITSIVAQLFLGVLATIIVMWFSRWREFRADAGGAQLAGRQNMISALARLDSVSRHGTDLPRQIEAMGIAGRAQRGFRRLFLSHPPIEERIAALQRAR